MKKEKNSQNQSAKAIKFILSYILKHKISFVLGILCLIAVDYIQLAIPKIIQDILDSISGNVFQSNVVLYKSLSIVGLALFMVVLRFFWRYFVAGSARKIEKNIRDDMFKHLQKLSFSFFNKTKTGDLMALMINDLNAIRMTAGPGLIGMTDTLFLGTLTIVFMSLISVKLTLFTIIPLFIIVVFLLIFGGKIRDNFKGIQETFASITSFTQETFSGIRVVKGFSQEEAECDIFEAKCEEYSKKNLKLAKIWGLVHPLVGFIATFSVLIYLFIGGVFTIQKNITLGEFVRFSFYITNLIWPMIAIGWVTNIMQQGFASALRVIKLFETKPEIYISSLKDNGQKSTIVNLKLGKIEIKNLTFFYDDKAVLKDINLTIPAGSTLGIIGKHGAGKTTLISLLFKIFKVGKGVIFVDGKDINKIPSYILRSSIGYVPQDMFLFSDTIENNILLGVNEEDEEAVQARVAEYSKMAALEGDINKFRDGYKTVIGERGISLSGGQKQRLSIARSLIINPDILILDDAFSSVDTRTEQEIINNIREEIKKRTAIIIAHRISTVRDCDNIIVLENGRITESGTHEKLLKNNGYYTKLFNIQKLGDRV